MTYASPGDGNVISRSFVVEQLSGEVASFLQGLSAHHAYVARLASQPRQLLQTWRTSTFWCSLVARYVQANTMVTQPLVTRRMVALAAWLSFLAVGSGPRIRTLLRTLLSSPDVMFVLHVSRPTLVSVANGWLSWQHPMADVVTLFVPSRRPLSSILTGWTPVC
jgi:hypothetical protein